MERGIGQTALEIKLSLVRPIMPETGVRRLEGIVLSIGRYIGATEGKLWIAVIDSWRTAPQPCLIFDA